MTPAFRVAFFDVDSTLVSIEGIDVLSGGDPRVTALTEAAMNGEVSMDDVYSRRLELIRPSEMDINNLAERYVASQIRGGAELMSALLEAGVDVHLVTAGIEQAVLPLAASLGLPPRAVHAVKLFFDQGGAYAGFDRHSPLTRAGGKELVVRDVRARSHGKAVFIGDGVTDLDAKPVVDLFIGFGGVQIRERVRDAAAIYLTEPTLLPLLSIVLEGKP